MSDQAEPSSPSVTGMNSKFSTLALTPASPDLRPALRAPISSPAEFSDVEDPKFPYTTLETLAIIVEQLAALRDKESDSEGSADEERSPAKTQ